MLATAMTTLLFNQKASELGRVRETFPDLPATLVSALPLMPQGSCIAQLPNDLLLTTVIPSAFELAVLSSRLQDRAHAQAIIQEIIREASS